MFVALLLLHELQKARMRSRINTLLVAQETLENNTNEEQATLAAQVQANHQELSWWEQL